MRKIKPAYILKILFLTFLSFSFSLSSLNSQSKLVGVVSENGVSSIYVIDADGSNYLEINPCEPNVCNENITLLGFNLENEILGKTKLDGDNGFGRYFKISFDGTESSTIRHFESNEDPYEFIKIIKSEEGELFGIIPLLLFKGVYQLNDDGSKGEAFFEPDFESIAGFYDGRDGFYYARGTSYLYRIRKSDLEVSVIKSFLNSSPIISQNYHISPPLASKIYGIVFGNAQGANGSSIPFYSSFKMQTDGSGYLIGGGLLIDLLPDYQNNQFYFTHDTSIIVLDLELTNSSIMKTFNNTVDEIGSSLQNIVIGEEDIIYGTTQSGGSFGNGTLFKMKKDGSGISILKHFNKENSQLLEWKGEVSSTDLPIETTDLIIYPNPTSEKLFIEYPNPKNETVEIYIFDELGKQLLIEKNINGRADLSISKFPVGVYFLRVIYPSNDSLNFQGKFIKR